MAKGKKGEGGTIVIKRIEEGRQGHHGGAWNAARRLLLDAGVAEGRIRSVAGMADREPHLPDQPGAAGNRRVAITLLRQAEAPRAVTSVPR